LSHLYHTHQAVVFKQHYITLYNENDSQLGLIV
jgi:hypothetical protein